MPKPSIVEKPAELLAYLFATWPEVKRKQVRTWLKFQVVTVNDRPVTQFNHALLPGDIVSVRSDRFAVPKTVLYSGMKVFFEDATLIVIDKPENLLSVASEAESEKTAYFQLTDYVRQGEATPAIAFGSCIASTGNFGLMIFAKTAVAKQTLQAGWDEAENVTGGRGRPARCQDGTFESDLMKRIL
jgi:23S rRNA pseudouridine1911/1915/1917 synthase